MRREAAWCRSRPPHPPFSLPPHASTARTDRRTDRRHAAGTPVTLYPVHAIGDSRRWLAPRALAASFGEGSARANRLDPSHPSLQDWAADLWTDAHRDRQLAGWLGHMPNDGAVCGGSDARSIAAYYEEGGARANVVLAPFGRCAAPLMCFVATRRISRGEEIFGQYGHEYWLSRAAQPLPPSSDAALAASKGWERLQAHAIASVERE